MGGARDSRLARAGTDQEPVSRRAKAKNLGIQKPGHLHLPLNLSLLSHTPEGVRIRILAARTL